VDGPFRKRYLMADVIVLAIVAVVILVLAVLGRTGLPPPDETVTIDAQSSSGRVLPAGFLGQSFEYRGRCSHPPLNTT
jgi:hypothetical protein